MKYQWKPGAHISIPAHVAATELLRIESRDGVLTPQAIVEDSRPASAPLHPAFEWDDQLAAEKYRLDQARYLVRSLVVVNVVEDQRAPVRAFVNVQIGPDDEDGKESVYRSTPRVLQDDELRRQILQRALAELAAWQRRYEDLEELANLLAAIQEQYLKISV
jgi:hypothetical protein